MHIHALFSSLGRTIRAVFPWPFSHSGLRFKLLSFVVGITFVGVLLSSFVVLIVQRQQLIDTTQDANTRLSSTIAASLRHAMIRNDWEMIDQTIRSIAGEKGSDHIRILDAHGTVRVSSQPTEVGSQLDRTSPTCTNCHASNGSAGSEHVIVPSINGAETLVNVNLIHNRSECYGCHDPRNGVLGLLLIETPLTELNQQLMTSFWLLGIIALLTFVLLVGMMMPALRQIILNPISELTRGVAAIRAGDLDHPVSAGSADELGDLANAFDAMRQQLNSSRAEMERRNSELGILNELALAASQWRDLQDIPAMALQTVADKTGMDAGAIFLFDPAIGGERAAAVRGLSPTQIKRIRQPNTISDMAAADDGAEEEPVAFVPDISVVRRFDGLWSEPQARSYVVLPLVSQGNLVGRLCLFSRVGQTLIARDVAVLKAMAHEISLAMDNALLLADATRREQETITLYRLMLQVSSSLELQDVFDAIAEGARQVLSGDIGVFVGLDHENRTLIVKASSGTRTSLLQNLVIPFDEAASDAVLLGRSIALEEWTPELQVPGIDLLIAEEGIASSLAVPMWRNGRLYAYVGVLTRQPRRFCQEEIQLLMRLTLQVAVAIENAELYRQVGYMATLEERDRLAREMHDNLAQKLGYLNIKASITDSWLNKGAVGEAHSSLFELQQIIQEAYTDVREGIFNLRMTDAAQQGLVETLHQYLAKYREHYGVDARLSIANGFQARLRADAEIQVMRIVQEALMNVRKHAETHQVFVSLAQIDHHIQVVVEDAGRGFDSQQVLDPGDSHFGLQIMRERAESIGGKLEIHSQPGHGTRLTLLIPLAIEN